MKKGAVIIGVDKTGDLPILNAAASGAINFSNWANQQGFDVTLLVDTNDRAVTVADISHAINQYVQPQTYSQLIVYFSGHGILRGPEYELWLLSGSPANSNEAVNLPGSILLARNAHIKHVVFISDACRSSPNTYKLNQVTGSVIFPNNPPYTPRPTVDVFYATLPGDTAWEIPPDEAASNYRGIFTDCILKGLNGTVPQVIVEVGQPPKVQRVVPPGELKDYLETEVPLAASDISIKLQQDPDIRVESRHPPSFLSLLSPTISKPTPGKPSEPSMAGTIVPKVKMPTFKDMIDDLQATAFRKRGEAPILSTDAVQSRPKYKILNESIERIVSVSVSAQEQGSFNRDTGFIIIGATVVEAVMSLTMIDNFNIFEYNGHSTIQILDKYFDHVKSKDFQIEDGRSILIIFSDGTGVLLAVLPGFVGIIVVEDGRVVTVNYTPNRGTDKHQEYIRVKEEVDKRRAFVAVAARNGSFRIADNQALEGAQYLRMLKSLDPTLGLYAAYAYIQAGRIDDVQSILEYMIEDSIVGDFRQAGTPVRFGSPVRIPMLFDVVLLAGLERGLPWKDMTVTRPIIMEPGCPMLTQGWAYIDSYRGKLNPIIIKAGRYLKPGLWTTFTIDGVSILREALLTGKL